MRRKGKHAWLQRMGFAPGQAAHDLPISPLIMRVWFVWHLQLWEECLDWLSSHNQRNRRLATSLHHKL